MLRNIFFQLHKWFGLVVGLVIFVISITGCIYVFHDELKLICYPQKYFLETKVETVFKPLSFTELRTIAQKSLPEGESITRADIYPAKNRTWVFRAQKTDEDAIGHVQYQKYYKRVFINPYTGEVQAVENTKYEFFQIVLQLHLNLLLGKKIGHPIVGISTILFIILLLSGIVIWFPKKRTKKSFKRSFLIKWKSKWKRLIYDFHNVLGFYSLFFALILGITGLVFAYPNFKKAYAEFFNFGPKSSISLSEKPFWMNTHVLENPLDDLIQNVLERHASADMMSVRLKANNQKQDVQVRLDKDKTSQFYWYYADLQKTEIDSIKSNQNLQIGDKLVAMNYDMHVGSIGGIPTKILIFIISFICASLPVTGFIVWWNKR